VLLCSRSNSGDGGAYGADEAAWGKRTIDVNDPEMTSLGLQAPEIDAPELLI
jgi:hypothetical protein